VRRERARGDALEAPHRAVEAPFREGPRLEAAADKLSGGGALDEQDLDRLALLLEVDRDVGKLALVSEAAGGECRLDRVPVAPPRDEVDVGVVGPDGAEQEVERPAAAQPERDTRVVERVGDLAEETELDGRAQRRYSAFCTLPPLRQRVQT
jgi:hypothetical protein